MRNEIPEQLLTRQSSLERDTWAQDLCRPAGGGHPHPFPDSAHRHLPDLLFIDPKASSERTCTTPQEKFLLHVQNDDSVGGFFHDLGSQAETWAQEHYLKDLRPGIEQAGKVLKEACGSIQRELSEIMEDVRFGSTSRPKAPVEERRRKFGMI